MYIHTRTVGMFVNATRLLPVWNLKQKQKLPWGKKESRRLLVLFCLYQNKSQRYTDIIAVIAGNHQRTKKRTSPGRGKKGRSNVSPGC